MLSFRISRLWNWLILTLMMKLAYLIWDVTTRNTDVLISLRSDIRHARIYMGDSND